MKTLLRALVRAADWRLLLLFVLCLAIPALVAAVPLHAFLSRLFNQLPYAAALARAFDSLTLTDLAKQLSAPANAAMVTSALGGGALVLFLVAPLAASFCLAAARADRPPLRTLLSDGGALYGRLLRFAPCSLIPIDLFAVGALLFKWASAVSEKATTAHAAAVAQRWAMVGFVLLFVVGQTIADAGRALFVAEPQRRSAFVAVWAGFRLVFRRPLRALAIGYGSWLLALASAGAILLVRLRVPEHGAGGVLLAFIVGQLAVAALGWGRAARLIALVDVARDDVEARRRKKALPAAQLIAAAAPPDPGALPVG